MQTNPSRNNGFALNGVTPTVIVTRVSNPNPAHIEQINRQNKIKDEQRKTVRQQEYQTYTVPEQRLKVDTKGTPVKTDQYHKSRFVTKLQPEQAKTSNKTKPQQVRSDVTQA